MLCGIKILGIVLGSGMLHEKFEFDIDGVKKTNEMDSFHNAITGEAWN